MPTTRAREVEGDGRSGHVGKDQIVYDGMVVSTVETGVEVRPQPQDVEPEVLGPLQQRVGAELLVELLGPGVGRDAGAEALERVGDVGGQGGEHHPTQNQAHLDRTRHAGSTRQTGWESSEISWSSGGT